MCESSRLTRREWRMPIPYVSMSLQQLDDELAHQIRIAKSHSAQYCEWPYASFRHQVASGSTPGPKKSKKMHFHRDSPQHSSYVMTKFISMHTPLEWITRYGQVFLFRMSSWCLHDVFMQEFRYVQLYSYICSVMFSYCKPPVAKSWTLRGFGGALLQNICGLFHGLLRRTREDKGRQVMAMRRSSEQITRLSLVQKFWRQSNLIGLGDCLKAQKSI